MKNEILDTEFNNRNDIISNVTTKPSKSSEIKKLYKQIEKPVRWRESVIYMINSGK